MGFRFRRRFRIEPDLRINVSKRSKQTTIGTPGTGGSYWEQIPRTPVRHGHPKTGGVVAAIALSALMLLAIALA